MHAGPGGQTVDPAAPSRAHLRVHGVVLRAASPFLDGLGGWPSEEQIQKALKLGAGYRPSPTTAVPLGEAGGVPPTAAEAPLAEVFARSHP
eukprot:1297793-Lingulodinium_polyedra.AAC.1